MTGIEREIERIVDERLAQLGITPSPSAFYTTVAGSWPPGCRTRRAARDRIRSVPEHTSEGSGRSMVWACSRTAYERHFVKRAPVVVPIASDEERIGAALTRAGLRQTRKVAA